MNTKKEVFNKLFKEDKTELATQKIELALIDDVNKKANTVVEDYRAISKQIQEINERKRKVRSMVMDLEAFAQKSKSMLKTSLNNASDLSKLISKLESEAKKLGIDYNYDLLAIEEKDIKDEVNKLEKLIQEINAKDY
jgi:uncharacterized phage infection (PIP) family protein YhgE